MSNAIRGIGFGILACLAVGTIQPSYGAVHTTTLPNGKTMTYAITTAPIGGDKLDTVHYASVNGPLLISFTLSGFQKKMSATIVVPGDEVLVEWKVNSDDSVTRTVELGNGQRFGVKSTSTGSTIVENTIATCSDFFTPSVGAVYELVEQATQVPSTPAEWEQQPYVELHTFVRTPFELQELHPDCVSTPTPEPLYGVCGVYPDWAGCQNCCQIDSWIDSQICAGIFAIAFAQIAGPTGGAAGGWLAGMACSLQDFDECEEVTCKGKPGDPDPSTCVDNHGYAGVCKVVCQHGAFGICDDGLMCCN